MLSAIHSTASLTTRTRGEREAARKKGGKERSRKAAVLPADTPDRPLKTAEDITELVADTINRVRRGELDPRIANSIGCLVPVY